MSRRFRLTLLIATVGLFTSPLNVAQAAEDTAALATALQGTTVTLQEGLKASEREGKPISASFEIEHDALQLSIYTLKGNDFMEVVADPKTGAIAKSEKITDAGDLKEAAAQKTAMAKATVSLLAATEAALRANAGFRAVGITPEQKEGHPTAEVNLLQGNTFKKIRAKLD